MSNRRTRLIDLANQAGLEPDEALVTVWDLGFEHYEDIDEYVRTSELRTISLAFGKVPDRDRQKISYWCAAWDLDESRVRDRLLVEFGVTVSERARTLPKGALRRVSKASSVSLDSRVIKYPNANVLLAEELSQTAFAPQFNWKCIGRAREIKFLTETEVGSIHNALCDDFRMSANPIEPSGVRDPGLLSSACQRPQTSLGSSSKYTTIESAAAALMHSLVHNHPFHNGNKRTALVATMVFLDENRVILTCDQQAIFKFVLQVSQHRLVKRGLDQRADREVLVMNEWLFANSRQKELGERVVKWNEFGRILQDLGCEIGKTLPGNRVKISRVVRRPRRGLLLARDRTQSVTAHKRNGGSEIDLDQIVTVRRELHLDDIHGYDSAHFYGDDRAAPDRFISEYRTLLKRLARL